MLEIQSSPNVTPLGWSFDHGSYGHLGSASSDARDTPRKNGEGVLLTPRIPLLGLPECEEPLRQAGRGAAFQGGQEMGSQRHLGPA